MYDATSSIGLVISAREKIVAAIKDFQKQNGLKVDGVMVGGVIDQGPYITSHPAVFALKKAGDSVSLLVGHHHKRRSS